MNVVIDVRSNVMAFAEEFKRLNVDWITTNFQLEESDIQFLSDPQKFILNKGGTVFIALYNNKPVGACTLLIRDGLTCELVNMVVDPQHQRQGIGYKLGQAFIEKARARGFSRIVLEGNTKMEAAVALYHKLGFQEIPLEFDVHDTTNHKRCNLFMELVLIHSEYFI